MGGLRRVMLGVAMLTVAALSASLLVYLGYLWNTARGLDDGHKLVITALRTPDTAHNAQHGANPVFRGQNLLLIGNDDRAGMTAAQVRELKVGRDGGSLNTDTMLIVHIPADGSRATLISLPRDSYVRIPGYGMNRLNAAYGLGYTASGGSVYAKRAAGADLLVRTIQRLTGVPIDHFVQVSLLGFVRISDAIGGVPINLCEDVDDTVAHNRSIGLTGGSGFKLPKGPHTIHGVQALEFVRQRENLDGSDIARTARQRYFLTAAFRTVTAGSMLLDLGKLGRLVDAVRQSVYPDDGLKILDLAKQLSNLSANNISGHVIPTDHYEDVVINGIRSNVGIVVPAQVRAYVRRLLSPPARHGHPRPSGPSRTKSRTAVDAGCIH